VLIEPVAVVAHRAVGVVKTSPGHVHQVVPVPVETGGRAMIDIHEEGLKWLLCGSEGSAKTAKEGN
jgi:hypothetical protein